MPRLQPQIPTPQTTLRHFKDMAEGRLPRPTSRKRGLFGGWGGSGPTKMKTELVTPTAQALEQAKSDLRDKGQRLPRRTPIRRKKRSASRRQSKKRSRKRQPTKRKKRSTIKGGGVRKRKPQPKKKRRGAGKKKKTFHDNFS